MMHFKKLKIWEKGFDIAVKTYQLVSAFPKEERFGLSSQMTKAGISIPSNIAEGSSRRSQKDYHRFIEISLGSAFELETQLLISQAVKFGNPELRTEILANLYEEQKSWLVLQKPFKLSVQLVAGSLQQAAQ